MEIVNGRVTRILWRVKEVGWNLLLAKGATRGIVVMWKKEKAKCKEVLMRETTIFLPVCK